MYSSGVHPQLGLDYQISPRGIIVLYTIKDVMFTHIISEKASVW